MITQNHVRKYQLEPNVEVKKLISNVLDIAVPVTGSILGTVAGGPGIPTALGGLAGKVTRLVIKKQLGMGNLSEEKAYQKKKAVKVLKNVASFGLDALPTVAGLVGSVHSPVGGLVAQLGTQVARDFIKHKTGVANLVWLTKERR